MKELSDWNGGPSSLHLGVVAEIADRVMVMYAGRKVEEAAVDDIFDAAASTGAASMGATFSAPRCGGSSPKFLAPCPRSASPPARLPTDARRLRSRRAARPGLTVPIEGRQVACFAQQRENHGHVAPVGA